MDALLEQLAEYVASDCKRAVDVSAYLERIHIQYLDLIKAKGASLTDFADTFLASSVPEDTSAQIVWPALSGSRLASRQQSGKFCVTRTPAK